MPSEPLAALPNMINSESANHLSPWYDDFYGKEDQFTRRLVLPKLGGAAEQTWLWTAGFYLLIVLIAGYGALMVLFPSTLPKSTISDGAESTAYSPYDALRWIGLAAVPAGLLLAVTVFISTDIAAVPLLWAMPLGLYLVTFIIAFQTRPLIPHWLTVKLAPYLVVGLIAIILASPISFPFFIIGVHLFVFFVVALLCHGELARRRPPPRFLTAYYMWISAGGVIGGISVGLFAPQLFNWVAEYQILIALSVLCLPGLAAPKRGTGQYPVLAVLVALSILMLVLPVFELKLPLNIMVLVLGAFGTHGILLALATSVCCHPSVCAGQHALLFRRTWAQLRRP